MIRKKSGFLTFCFSLMPGAGQMYMGFMKRGVSLMSVFWLLIFLASWLNLGPLMFAMPVIWFFAFFDALNLKAMPDDEFYAMEDNYILIPDLFSGKMKLFQEKYRNIIALVLIIIGFAILWNNIYDLVRSILPDELSYYMYRIGYYFPQFLVGFAIIAFGLYLIRGKKKDLDSQEKTTAIEDKGGFSI